MRTEVVEQQEAAVQVGSVQLRRADSGAAQQTEHRAERPAVLHRRRRVHRDPRPRVGVHPEVAAEARVFGCRLEPEVGGLQGVAQPPRECGASWVESVPICHRNSLRGQSTPVNVEADSKLRSEGGPDSTRADCVRWAKPAIPEPPSVEVGSRSRQRRFPPDSRIRDCAAWVSRRRSLPRRRQAPLAAPVQAIPTEPEPDPPR